MKPQLASAFSSAAVAAQHAPTFFQLNDCYGNLIVILLSRQKVYM